MNDTNPPSLPARCRPLLFRLAPLVLLCIPLVACSGSFSFARIVTFEDSAAANYKKGMLELKDENYLEAAKYFSHVKNKFPFSRFATLAELRLADTYFEEGKFPDAVDAYRQFVKFHPTHPETTNGYASFRVCKAYYKQIPSDWFLVPPSHEKDLAATHDALRSVTLFAKRFPKSKYLDDSKDLKRKCVRHIADHELYVARFYLSRERPKAAIMRLERLLKEYPDAGVDPEVMLLLGKTFLAMEQRDRARTMFSDLVTRYPDDPYSEKAKLYLAYLGPKPAKK